MPRTIGGTIRLKRRSTRCLLTTKSHKARRVLERKGRGTVRRGTISRNGISTARRGTLRRGA
eukprot:1484058-Rhodomonas_salina.3